MTTYQDAYRQSIEQPEEFWAERARALSWFHFPDTILSQDNNGFYRWFKGGQLNTSYLALDYHVDHGRADQTALIYDSPVTDTRRSYTYRELRDEVARVAGGLLKLGVGKGDRVIIYMPFDLKRIHFNDVARLRNTLAEHGLEVLHNRSLHLRHKPGQSDGVDIHLAGVDDVTEGTPDLVQTLRQLPSGEPNILLSHNPDILEEPDSRRADLILAGHTHGGQIVLPWLGAAHTHSEHLKRREAAGYMRRDQTHVYVSRGIGEGIPLRFGARPQIALITVVGE